MNKEDIEKRIEEISEKVRKKEKLTDEENRFYMKEAFGMSDIEIEFAMSDKPEQNGKNGIVY
ncbi:MAG TPA: hypothetical protein VK154_14875 [Chitinophagales bacterium]|nr:hypothetical protein [Chitinophagales bacterium]